MQIMQHPYHLLMCRRKIIVGEREGSFYEAVKKSGWSGVVVESGNTRFSVELWVLMREKI